MATVTNDYSSSAKSTQSDWAHSFSLAGVLAILGSLKMTVVLFALSLILVLVGTLAQDQLNMQEVKARYFMTWIAMMHIDDFFPQAFYQHDNPIPGIVPFPGGAMIGMLLMINLVAAKITRFRLQASGSRLIAGLAFLMVGIVIAGFIVLLGHNDDGLQGTPPMSYGQLWALILATLSVGSIGVVMAASTAKLPILRWLGYLSAAAIASYVVYSLVYESRIGDPGLRIVWQLAKGLGAGLVMMLGCQLAFGKQGGNVLLHLGVGLLMVGQFAFGDRQTEQRLSLVEGESTNTFVNLDEIELQFIRTEDQIQRVTAIPVSRLLTSAENESIITDPNLPVKIKTLRYYENSSLRDISADGDDAENNLADTGIGKTAAAIPIEKSGGAAMTMNMPAAYIELLDTKTDESLGTYLVAHKFNDGQMLIPDGQTKDFMDSVAIETESGEKADYQFGLRMHREVKPYWVQLDDVRRIDYSGSDTPRDYSSFIRIVDTETGAERKERVWMNNPLRYRGETFYQSSYSPLPGGKELTGIQVVRNSGWLIPYVACSITGLGMLVHFWGTLSRFISRRRRETINGFADGTDPFDSQSNDDSTGDQNSGAVPGTRKPNRRGNLPVVLWISSVAALVVFALIPAKSIQDARRPTERDAKFDYAAAGRIPVQVGGRIMPLDAYARQTMKAMTNKDSLPMDHAPSKIQERVDGKKMSAVQWLMEVAIDQADIRRLPMFRIDAEAVRSELDLDRRESKLYSLQELGDNIDRFTELVNEARSKEPRDQEFKDKKLIELDMRTRSYTLAAASFRLPIPDEIPAELFPEGTSEQTRQLFALRRLEQQMESLVQMKPPALIPPPAEESVSDESQPQWTAFAPAFFDMAKSGLSEADSPVGIRTFGEMIRAYGKEDPLEFNEAVDAHLAAVRSYPIDGYDYFAVSLERWLGGAAPTAVATGLYILAFILGLIAMAINSPRMTTAVWGTLLIAFLVHTLIIASRVYITGRAPVINLYSSAIFVGWAAVLFGLVVERIFRYGTGNLLAGFAGLLTLRVADYITLNVGQAETMGVLQAVLDTQFWLTTHVISVSLGYVATLVAGTLGMGYLIAGWMSGWINISDRAKRDLYRVIYGATCFGILFSFIGTVLGGLWADDSWGRFWGWDPKENGALLIVIWNALMLHARWDGMVKAHGFALLAIGGNIVTAWSWFGTNELGIGLHSYGFTEGMLLKLSFFFAVQMLFIVAGLIFSGRGSSNNITLEK